MLLEDPSANLGLEDDFLDALAADGVRAAWPPRPEIDGNASHEFEDVMHRALALDLVNDAVISACVSRVRPSTAKCLTATSVDDEYFEQS